MLGPAEDGAHGGAVQAAQQRPAGHPAQDVVMAQRDSAELAADEGRADVADDGFDFGELGHRSEI